MALQDMVKNVERVGDDLLVVEFNNGLAVGYEKNGGEVAWGIINRKKISYQATVPMKLEAQAKTEYSEKALRLFFDYGAQKDRKLENEQLALVKRLIEPLDIQTTRSIDYGTVAQNIGIGLCSPVLFPLGVVCSALAAPTGNETLSTLGMLGRYAPTLAFYGLKELVNPSKQWMKLGNKDALASENDGTLPAIAVAKKFDGLEPVFATKQNFDQFSWLEMFFPSGHHWFIHYGPYYSTDIAFARAGRNNKGLYENSRYFLKANKSIQRQLTALLEEEESFGRKAEDFKGVLTTEQQRALLNHLGFVKK